MNDSEKLDDFINKTVDDMDEVLEKLKKNNQSIKDMKCKGCALCSTFLQRVILREFDRIVLSGGLAIKIISPLIHHTISNIEDKAKSEEVDKEIEKLEKMFNKEGEK